MPSFCGQNLVKIKEVIAKAVKKNKTFYSISITHAFVKIILIFKSIYYARFFKPSWISFLK